MKLSAHVPLSLSVGAATYAVWRSPTLSISCLLFGIFIDLDHFYDYFMSEGFRLDIKDFFYKCYHYKLKKLYLILHSYELLFLLFSFLFVVKSDILLGVFIGMLSHIIADVLGNPVNFVVYSFIYRYKNNFGEYGKFWIR